MSEKQAKKARVLEQKHQKMAKKTIKKIDHIVAIKVAEALAVKEGEAMKSTLTYLKCMPLWKKCQFFIELLWLKEVAIIGVAIGAAIAGLMYILLEASL